jgi:hypothetical protein
MAGVGSALGFFGTAVQDLFAAGGAQATSEGLQMASADYTRAAQFSYENAHIAGIQGAVQATQLSRQIALVGGKVSAGVAGAGGTEGGSAGDILRSSVTEGGLASAGLAIKTQMTVEGYKQQGLSYTSQAAQASLNAEAAKGKASGAMWGAAFNVAGGLFALL